MAEAEAKMAAVETASRAQVPQTGVQHHAQALTQTAMETTKVAFGSGATRAIIDEARAPPPVKAVAITESPMVSVAGVLDPTLIDLMTNFGSQALVVSPSKRKAEFEFPVAIAKGDISKTPPKKSPRHDDDSSAFFSVDTTTNVD